MNLNLLTTLAQQFLGGAQGNPMGNQNNFPTALIGIVISLIQSHPGGLMGLIQQFESSGLAAQAQSWVSTGANMPVTPGQIQQAINPTQMTQLGQVAQQSGAPKLDIASALATFLPQIVDHLTPNGNVPHDKAVAETLATLKNALNNINVPPQQGIA
ncbi:MAG: YidB family protein [Alphaproteobacteria bacterium]